MTILSLLRVVFRQIFLIYDGLNFRVRSIDAMGCQFEIEELILKKEGHYIFSLKGNEGNLFDDIQFFLNDPKQMVRLEKYQNYDKGHGRIETRSCWVCHDVSWLKPSFRINFLN